MDTTTTAPHQPRTLLAGIATGAAATLLVVLGAFIGSALAASEPVPAAPAEIRLDSTTWSDGALDCRDHEPTGTTFTVTWDAQGSPSWTCTE